LMDTSIMTVCFFGNTLPQKIDTRGAAVTRKRESVFSLRRYYPDQVLRVLSQPV
jgi:hypothetical protein